VADTTLVIVESPAKAKKIAGYLGPDYTVMASVGHVRDLASKASELPESLRKQPWAKYAVDVDGDFEPFYVVHDSKKKTIADLKKALKEADALLLATDEDREGEAISWHLMEVLRPKVPVQRMVFNEITPDAIRDAVSNPRDLDMRLVEAQETRRIVDRLYGFPVSQVLWMKLGREARSAGRVQSVAVRLVVDRERERIAFRAADYWDITGDFAAGGGSFEARLTSVDSVRVASGSDFDRQGALKKDAVVVLDEVRARSLAVDLDGADFTVRSVVQKPGQRQPKPPFITSTLQQEASNRLRWGSQRTMRVAQSLYENGYITYMRTDSVHLSEQAVSAARSQARQLFGAEFVSDGPRVYKSKVKNAQEAHEAIRPAGDVFHTPGEVSRELNADEFALYDLIWRRTVASQMANAQVATTTVKLGAVTAGGTDAEFTASGTVVVFAGFYAALKDVEENGETLDADAPRERELPRLGEGDAASARELTPEGHTTSPPARYTEASLVKALEELGIGRPSTYASIMTTIIDRGYVWKKGSALVPSFTAFAVIRLLEEHFTDLISYQFTANMEDVLDLISVGETDKLAQLQAFWRGGPAPGGGEFPGVKSLTEDLGSIDSRALATFPIPGSDASLRVGRYGAYVERGEERANIPVGLAPDELTAEKAEQLLLEPSGDRELGSDPDSGLAIVAKSGRYGPYVSEVLPEGSPKSAKPRTASLLSSMSLSTVTFEDALRLLSLPRLVGADPADGGEILAHNGRYGPYLTKGTDSRSLASEDEIFTVTLEQALALFAQPKQRRGRGQAKPPVRELGNDPTTGLPLVIKDGRFGLYVTDGTTNASLRTADDPETMSIERASDLLSERRSKEALDALEPKQTTARVVKRGAKKTAKKATRKTAKKAPAKKAAAKSPGSDPADAEKSTATSSS
jgi:DNA topoisomerase-1